MPGEKGFSEGNIRYMYRFYKLYSQYIENLLQGVEDSNPTNLLHGIEDFNDTKHPHGADDLLKEICSIPWFHQQRIIDKCKEDAEKALFFVRKVIIAVR